MNKTEIVNEMYEAIKDYGLTVILHHTYRKNIKIKIGYSKESCEASIENLVLSVRSYNALMRSGLTNVGAVIEAANSGELPKIRNLGQKSYNEIRQRLVEYGYMELSDKGRKEFLSDLISLNC